MADSRTDVTIGNSHFDVAGVGDWIASHVWLFLLVAFVGFMFWVFQKGGFAEKFLAYRTRVRELDAKKLDDLRAITDIFRRRYDRPDPLLPFDDDLNGTE